MQSSPHAGSMDETQVVRLAIRCLTHLTSPSVCCLFEESQAAQADLELTVTEDDLELLIDLPA